MESLSRLSSCQRIGAHGTGSLLLRRSTLCCKLGLALPRFRVTSTMASSPVVSAFPNRPKSVQSERPKLKDIEQISWGKRAGKRGTGSRAVPHRLNSDERRLFVLAQKKGYLTILGTGYRHERKGAPLNNTWRQWCDALAIPCVTVVLGAQGMPDSVVQVDLSPLRLADLNSPRAAVAAIAASGSCTVVDGGPAEEEQEQEEGQDGSREGAAAGEEPAAEEELAAARKEVEDQASVVRALKAEPGATNTSPQVKEAVAVLLARKDTLAALESQGREEEGGGDEEEWGEEDEWWGEEEWEGGGDELVAWDGRGPIWLAPPAEVVVSSGSRAGAKLFAEAVVACRGLREAALDWKLAPKPKF